MPAAATKAAQAAPAPRPRGRPPVPSDRALSGRVRARVTPAQEAKFEALGGSEWLRRAIDRAKLPKAKPPGLQMRSTAPWPDFAGHPIRERDLIRHPDGATGTVVLQPGPGSAQSRWRVDYGDGSPTLALCLQIGDKGRAVVIPKE